MASRARTISGWVLKSIGILIAAILLYQLWLFGWVCWYAWQPPQSSAIMREEIHRLRETDPEAGIDYRWVDYAQINVRLKQAVVAAEDGNFVEHGGVDWDAIESAYAHNRELEEAREAALARGRKPSSRPMRGGSTITQQLAKNLLLSNERSYVRKGQELVITYMIELVMSKQRILELYLNVAEWGEGVFGAEAAAQHYFGVPASKLSAYQSAKLAAMLPRPRFYDKNRNSAYLASRTDVLARRIGSAEIP